ncbi:MAG: RidA family protein [Betaproteobacteria bacterium]|nr:RidA family protein [Betaproteobacteria bacterium]
MFATGQLAVDFEHGGIAADVLRSRSPLSGRPGHLRESARVFDHLEQVLAAGGSSLARIVRSDQYFTNWAAVSHYHTERVRRFRPLVPPTTSVLVPGLLYPDASLDAQFIALAPAFDAPIEAVYPPGLHVPSTSGFAPVVRAGDHVFIAGFMAAHQPGDLGGIAPEAKVPDGHLWKGTRIKLEADYAMKHKIAVALEGAGSSIASMVKAQVYLRDMHDLPAFNEVWERWFPDARRRPAVSYIPTSTPGFAIEDARLEINAIGLVDGATTRRRNIDGGFHTGIDGQPGAVLAGDLLLCSALLAADADGPLPGCLPDPAQPCFGSATEAQVDHIVDRALALCAAAGTTLSNMARLQLFMTDLGELDAAWRAFQRRLPGLHLPLSAVQVPGPLPVPGCTVMADLWVYAP